MSGSWEDISLSKNGGNLYNRGDIRFNFLPLGLTLRGEVLDKRTIDFKSELPWGDPEKTATNILGGLYHKSTGSRLLYGVIDEWGLSARIRNPWIRSPPYAENHKPLMADLKTAPSAAKNDEVYLYLSSPFLNIVKNIKIRSFITAQTETAEFTPAFSSGVDFTFTKKSGLLFEVFYSGATLPSKTGSSWFSNPPPLPEREFDLYSAGLLFHNPFISVSSDFAVSKTFAWGVDIYGNLGITLTPALPFGTKARPLSVSFAVDGAGERFIYRDGAGHGEGFRIAGKAEWKGGKNSLLRFNTMLRGPETGEGFNRSSTELYYRFPAARGRNSENYIIRFTRISLSADRNAENSQKISDKLSWHIGLYLNLEKIRLNTPLGINLYGSIRGLTASADSITPYPIPKEFWSFDAVGVNCEFLWSPLIFQFRSKIGYTNTKKKNENEEKLDFSFSSAARFKYGRFGFKVFSSDLADEAGFLEKWNLTVSWRLEKK